VIGGEVIGGEHLTSDHLGSEGMRGEAFCISKVNPKFEKLSHKKTRSTERVLKIEGC